MSLQTTLRWAPPYSLALMLGAAAATLLLFFALRWLAGRPADHARRWPLWVLRGMTLAAVALVLFNPVRVDESPGPVERPSVVYLLDSSQSMALAEGGKSRFQHVLDLVGTRGISADPRAGARVSVFQFGDNLAAVDPKVFAAGVAPPPATAGSALGSVHAAEATPTPPTPAATQPDTLLAASLEKLAGRFGQNAPQAVVVFSDGRARDSDRVDPIARAYAKMNIPVHVYPIGASEVGGDVAIVSMVVPAQVRKYAQVAAQVFVRSFGYKGRAAELKIVALDSAGKPGAVLVRTPVTLRDGLAGYTLTFPAGDEDRRIAALIDPQAGEVSGGNNQFAADMAIDHTKIRVLYLEGATDRYVEGRARGQNADGAAVPGGLQMKGAYSSLQEALMEDPDIECTAVMPAGASGDFSLMARSDERARGMPETASELYAYDAIILSNVPREALTDQHIAWIEDWISRRGGGLCMAGGPNGFTSGQWIGSPVAKMLPVELLPITRDWDDSATALRPIDASTLHPFWHITADDAHNRSLLKTLPVFQGRNKLGRIKAGAEVEATTADESASPLIVSQPFGRGRTLAVATGITRKYANDFTQRWGENDARYYKKFWRNVVYWLTENSSIGRRRLLAETDKRLYRPGEPIVLKARTFDENAAPTLSYRVAVSVEPKSASDVTSDDSPLRRPVGLPGAPTEAGGGPLLPWGEEFELTRRPADDGYAATLAIADGKSLPPGVAMTQGLRIELTAYENSTQVDSTALEVQILDDPTEQQNPLPDHALLRRVAEHSGGTVLHRPADLTSMLASLPRVVGPSEIKVVPAWSRWWLLVVIVSLLTVEWVWRRRLGLA